MRCSLLRTSLLATFGVLSAQVSPPPQPPRLFLDGVYSGPLVLQDGKTVIFSSNFTPDGSLVFQNDVYALNSGGIRRLTALPSDSAIRGLDVTPDGSRIAVATQRPSSLVVIDTATASERIFAPLTANGTDIHAVRFTPDARTILINVHPFTGHEWFPFLYSVPVEGGTPVLLARGATDGRYPISDDGTIVFTSPGPTDNAYTTISHRNVYTMKIDGTQIKQLTQFSDEQSGWPSLASITPDGKRILFVTDVATTSTKIWTVDADGRDLRPLPPVAPAIHSVAFSRDGSLVAWVNGAVIHLTKVDTGEDRVLAGFSYSDVPGFGTGMDLAPDDSALYFLIGEIGYPAYNLASGSALWSVDLRTGSLQRLYAPRTLSPGGILGPGPSPMTLTPGGFVTVYGTNLAIDSLTVAPGPALPTSLAGVSLLINDKPAAMLALTPWQVNAQIPMDTQPGQASFQFKFEDGTASQIGSANVSPAAPMCVTAVHAGSGTLVDETHPAVAGEVLATYGLGAGPTNPLVATGQPAPSSPLATLTIPLTVDIEFDIPGSNAVHAPAKVLWTGLSPGAVGLYQVNVQLPPQFPLPLSAPLFLSWHQNGSSVNECPVWVH